MTNSEQDALGWKHVAEHLQQLARALVRYSEKETVSIWKRAYNADVTDGASAASSTAKGITPPEVMVKSFFTHRGSFQSVFYSQLCGKGLFDTQFLKGANGEEKNYFLEAYGKARVAALREGRFIALVKRKKDRRDLKNSAGEEFSHRVPQKEEEDDDEEVVEVKMEEEEAREREKLGLQNWTLQLHRPVLPSALPSAVEDHHPPPTSFLLRISELRKTLSTPVGAALFRKVWRSKGFFYALDDEEQNVVPLPKEPQQRQSSTSSPLSRDVPLGGSVETTSMTSTSHSLRNGTPTAKVKQFRWQTAENHIHYGEVLPPYVPLFAKEDDDIEGDSWREKNVPPHGTSQSPLVHSMERNGIGKDQDRIRVVGEKATTEEEIKLENMTPTTASSSPKELQALIIFLGNFAANTEEGECMKNRREWEESMKALFTTGTVATSPLSPFFVI